MSVDYDKMKVVASWNRAMLNPCEEVGDIETEIRPFIPYLIRTMFREDGMAISANQVGISKKVFIMNVPGDHIRIVINPVIEQIGGGILNTKEGCISLPNKQVITQRKRHVIMRAFNLKGEQYYLDTTYRLYPEKTSMLLAVCMQHEMDHMNGVDLRAYL